MDLRSLNVINGLTSNTSTMIMSFYGRFIDDVLIVCRNNKMIKSTKHMSNSN